MRILRAFTLTVMLLSLLLAMLMVADAAGAKGGAAPPHDAYCDLIGQGVSPDPDLPGNWARIYDLHSRGCDEYYGAWVPRYVHNVNYRCNVIAHRYAKLGLPTNLVIALTLKHGCVHFEDGTYGAKLE